MKSVTPFITFDGRAEEAINLYCSLVDNSKVHSVQKWGPDGPVSEGSVLTAEFELNGRRFLAMDVDGGFPLGEGFSLMVDCETQEEVDRLYDGLSADGGEKQPCGWVLDRFGVSWQIVPIRLGELMSDPDREAAQRVTEAMLQMQKIDIAGLEAAYKG